MKILSLDTSSSFACVSILENDNIIKEVCLNSQNTHSQTLMPLISQILLDTNLQLNDINLLATSIGPGSFTGIRIGISTVLGLSDAQNIPISGISSLESLAYNVKTSELICSLIDAKHDNVYYGLFNIVNNNYVLKDTYSFDNINIILGNLKMHNIPITFIGDGAINYTNLIQNIFNNTANILPANKYNISSSNIGKLAFYKFKNSIKTTISPMYLKKTQAEILLERNSNL